MNPNVKPNEQCTLVGVIDPDAYTAATYTSGWVSLVDFLWLMAIVFAGTLGTNATLDAKLEQATDASGTGAKDVTGKAITQLTQAGTDSDKQAILLCRGEELDRANGFTHVRLSMTIAVATSDAAAALFGCYARYQPEDDLSTVDEVIS